MRLRPEEILPAVLTARSVYVTVPYDPQVVIEVWKEDGEHRGEFSIYVVDDDDRNNIHEQWSFLDMLTAQAVLYELLPEK